MQYEYAKLMEYVAYKGSFLKGAPVMAYFHITENEDELIEPAWLLTAMNELGADGWQEYRVDCPREEPGKRGGMTAYEVKLFQKRYGWAPAMHQIESTRWFRRVVG